MLALDVLTQVADGELEGEIDRLEEHGEPEVPSYHAGGEGAGAFSDEHAVAVGDVAGGRVPVGGREEAEGDDEEQEDDDQADVGAQGADHVHQTQQTHEDEEEGE